IARFSGRLPADAACRRGRSRRTTYRGARSRGSAYQRTRSRRPRYGGLVLATRHTALDAATQRISARNAQRTPTPRARGRGPPPEEHGPRSTTRKLQTLGLRAFPILDPIPRKISLETRAFRARCATQCTSAPPGERPTRRAPHPESTL